MRCESHRDQNPYSPTFENIKLSLSTLICERFVKIIRICKIIRTDQTVDKSNYLEGKKYRALIQK